jgi:hypothetical protein
MPVEGLGGHTRYGDHGLEVVGAPD